MVISPTPVAGFPSVSLDSDGGLPVEVTLLGQLGPGEGDRLHASTVRRQRHHPGFVDALDEPSVRIGDSRYGDGDPSSLYTFTVGRRGHPFHRHAGRRVFTAVSGSGGARLRFSTTAPEQLAKAPDRFLHDLRQVDIPPDCLFTVRFGGAVWHQFAPLSPGGLHPALCAVSSHPDDRDGPLSPAMRNCVLAGDADIPALTELPPVEVQRLLADPHVRVHAPTTRLFLGSPRQGPCALAYRALHCVAGLLRGQLARLTAGASHIDRRGGPHAVIVLRQAPTGSLLRQQLHHQTIHHEDTFVLECAGSGFAHAGAERLLARVLDGFLVNPPAGVSILMALRNLLVKPLGLRTSPLGCPVSSLLGPAQSALFAGRFPVRDQRVDPAAGQAEVILGADDRHLVFRSCVGVQISLDGRVRVTLGTRVSCRNGFGRAYMGLIERAHRNFVAPAMLRAAVDHAFPSRVAGEPPTGESG